MEKSKLIVSYGRDADVTYLSFGEPKPSVTEELDDYVFVRRDPKTREIRGVTITNFSKYFKAKKEIKVEIPEP
ncbi:MAG: DUF2283 domain-containing protein [Thaumarchaeota archaeon]|nr:DUF2283 domain-containing protein [Nitrososphaerota archaeon]